MRAEHVRGDHLDTARGDCELCAEIAEPLAECDACGDDLFVGQPHDCPVLGTTVTVTVEDEGG